VIRYAAGQPVEGYTTGAPLVLCPACGMAGHADRNASVVIGQRLIARYQDRMQEKPPTPRASERVSKETGVVVSQDAESETSGPSTLLARHRDGNAPGTAHEPVDRDGGSGSDMPPPLREALSRSQAASAPFLDYRGVSEAAGL
jgi:ribosomal protein S27AE